MALGNIMEHFPQLVPEGVIDVDGEQHVFEVLRENTNSSSTKYTYLLDKAPVVEVEEVTGTVNGRSAVFEQGTDYAVIDDDNDGQIDTIDFDVGGDQPDDNTTFTVQYRARPVIERYAEGHEDETSNYEQLTADAVSSIHIDEADTVAELERIGAIFGELGKRRGRGREEYRAFLKTIVQSFNGRGTKPGIKFAIAAGVGTDTENITIIEDFVEVGYEIRVDNVDTAFVSSVINEMADLADPSGVELLSPPVIILDGEDVIADESGATVVSTSVGLGGDTLTLDGNSTLQ